MEIEVKAFMFWRLFSWHVCSEVLKVEVVNEEETEVHELESTTQIAVPIGFRAKEEEEDYEDRVRLHRAAKAASLGYSA